MILALVQAPGELPTLYRCPRQWAEYLDATFSPESTVYAVCNTALSGKTYSQIKRDARKKLRLLSAMQSRPGLSYAELATIQNAAEKISRRAGLIQEARENGII
jgi:hypothetical protein